MKPPISGQNIRTRYRAVGVVRRPGGRGMDGEPGVAGGRNGARARSGAAA